MIEAPPNTRQVAFTGADGKHCAGTAAPDGRGVRVSIDTIDGVPVQCPIAEFWTAEEAAELQDVEDEFFRAQVIIADPAWEYRVLDVQGDVSEQYSTMSYAELAALPVRDWAASNCVLAMWGTWAKLDEGVDLLRAWEFDYVTGFPWIKTVGTAIRRGIGFWTQSTSEVVLIGRKGEPRKNGHPAPVMGLLHGEERQFYAPGGAPGTHSRKPYGLHEWLAEMFDGPYLELFARRPHPGWVTWGKDLGFLLTPGGVARCEPSYREQRDLFAGEVA